MNTVTIAGHLTRDPELRQTGNGKDVGNMGIAVNNNWTDKEGTKHSDPSFFNVVAWNGLGTNCAKFLTKGSHVAITGRLQSRNYEDNNGNKRTTVEIIASEVDFLDKKGDAVKADVPDDEAVDTDSGGVNLDDMP